MNRRKFVLSWGRKIFFGLSWPLTSILGLIYLKSYILPASFADAVYYGANFVGHFGLLNALVYFLFYCPIVLLMPTYYTARFWSLILILILNFSVLIDGLMFSSYHLHSYSFLSKLFIEQGLTFFPGASGILTALAIGAFVVGIVIWIRGERTWRYMQGKFSNPVKNWYLVFIFVCLVISKLVYHYGSVDHRLTELFPVDLNFKREEVLERVDHRKFYYPADKIVCPGKTNQNLVMITIKEWNADDLNSELMPLVSHMTRHGTVYKNHHSGSTHPNDGIFSLYYSLPSTYFSSVHNTYPAIITELNHRQYEVVDFVGQDQGSPQEKDETAMRRFQDWLAARSDEIIRPYSLNITLEQHPGEADKIVQAVIQSLLEKDLLKGTHIIMTGGAPGKGAGYRVPLLVINPSRQSGEIDHVTSHYDLMPSTMEAMWGCKKVFQNASVGKPLDHEEREWLLVTNTDGFEVLDFKNSVTTTVENHSLSDVSWSGTALKPRRELILEALKLTTKFSKP